MLLDFINQCRGIAERSRLLIEVSCGGQTMDVVRTLEMQNLVPISTEIHLNLKSSSASEVALGDLHFSN